MPIFQGKKNDAIRAALNTLINSQLSDLQKFQRQIFKISETVVACPNTPVPSVSNARTKTPNVTPLPASLEQVEDVTKSALAKNVVTTRRGRRLLTEIYNKMRKRKKVSKSQKGCTRRPYDADGKGDDRFIEAYKLMFVEGCSANKAALQTVGKSQQNAFRIALCK